MKNLSGALFLSTLILCACNRQEKKYPAFEPPVEYDETPIEREHNFNAFTNAYINVAWDSIKAIARKEKEPVIVYFSGYACVNARQMEHALLDDEETKPLLRNRKIIILMLDERQALPFSERYISPASGDSVTRMGQRGIDIQNRFNKNFQPCFLKLDDSMKIIDSLDYQSTWSQRRNFFRK